MRALPCAAVAASIVMPETVLAHHTAQYRRTWAQIKPSIDKLKLYFGLHPNGRAIIVDPSQQKLHLIQGKKILRSYLISTAKAGMGSERFSGKTPIGTHRIMEKFGYGVATGTIFKGRRDTGKIAQIYTDQTDIIEDHITTRILWLDGQEYSVNRGGSVDSKSRYIYIHGTPEEGLIGSPSSHGCIRMKNSDVVELFDLVALGTLIEIQNKPTYRVLHNSEAV